MKLNHECVRDVMLYLEENLQDMKIIYSKDINLENHEYSDIIYSLKKLADAGYIFITSITMENTTVVSAITWNGHQFLDTIRDVNIWEQTKSKVSKALSSASIEMLSAVALNLIKSKLGI